MHKLFYTLTLLIFFSIPSLSQASGSKVLEELQAFDELAKGGAYTLLGQIAPPQGEEQEFPKKKESSGILSRLWGGKEQTEEKPKPQEIKMLLEEAYLTESFFPAYQAIMSWYSLALMSRQLLLFSNTSHLLPEDSILGKMSTDKEFQLSEEDLRRQCNQFVDLNPIFLLTEKMRKDFIWTFVQESEVLLKEEEILKYLKTYTQVSKIQYPETLINKKRETLNSAKEELHRLAHNLLVLKGGKFHSQFRTFCQEEVSKTTGAQANPLTVLINLQNSAQGILKNLSGNVN